MVANEVKDVSRQITEISHQMNARTRSITKCVMDGHELLKDVATSDLEGNILAKDTLEKMLHGLMEQTEAVRKIMRGSMETSRTIAQAIEGMIVDMQFQDRNSQIAENAAGMLASCAGLASGCCAETRQVLGFGDTGEEGLHMRQAFDAVFASIRLGDIRFQYIEALRKLCGNAAHLPKADGMASSGDVDLF